MFVNSVVENGVKKLENAHENEPKIDVPKTGQCTENGTLARLNFLYSDTKLKGKKERGFCYEKLLN